MLDVLSKPRLEGEQKITATNRLDSDLILGAIMKLDIHFLQSKVAADVSRRVS